MKGVWEVPVGAARLGEGVQESEGGTMDPSSRLVKKDRNNWKEMVL